MYGIQTQALFHPMLNKSAFFKFKAEAKIILFEFEEYYTIQHLIKRGVAINT